MSYTFYQRRDDEFSPFSRNAYLCVAASPAVALRLQSTSLADRVAELWSLGFMRATIQKLNMALPYCDARSDSDILFVFRPPATGLHLGDIIEFDHTILETDQMARNITTAGTFQIHLRERNIHDLRLPAAHGSSRFPSLERFNDV